MIKACLKKCLPPVFIDFYRICSYGRLPASGVYDTWEHACERLHGKDYCDREISALVAFRTKQLLKNPETLPFSLSALQTIAAMGQILIETEKSRLSVLDIGGACGLHYHQIKKCFPSISFDWHVLETEVMAEDGSKTGNYEELKFFTKIGDLTAYDFIHCSGTLGYIPECESLLDSILGSGCEYILLSRTSHVKGEKDIFITQWHPLHLNGPGKMLPPGFKDKVVGYPARIFSKERLKKKLQRNYTIRWEVDDNSAFISVQGHEVGGISYFMQKK
ncbi:MAG: methyltransferase, TIGR04325 family [Victivallales bacterium]|nr:hypothetical protein [Lentisphaeria bacterium]HCG48092.1 hypothetical protein [Lentisphaeria bacterium]